MIAREQVEAVLAECTDSTVIRRRVADALLALIAAQPVQQPAAVPTQYGLAAYAQANADFHHAPIPSLAAAVAGQEPAAYFYDDVKGNTHLVKDRWPELLKCGYSESRLYTAPVPAAGVQPKYQSNRETVGIIEALRVTEDESTLWFSAKEMRGILNLWGSAKDHAATWEARAKAATVQPDSGHDGDAGGLCSCGFGPADCKHYNKEGDCTHDSDSGRDAALYQWWKKNRSVSLLTSYYGNGCVNRTIKEMEAEILAAHPAPPSDAGLSDCRKYCQREADEVEASKDVIKEAVNRFLGWKLPHNFSPDNGIEFYRPEDKKFWPIGTNLFTADEAKAMFEHCIAAHPAPPSDAHPRASCNCPHIGECDGSCAPYIAARPANGAQAGDEVLVDDLVEAVRDITGSTLLADVIRLRTRLATILAAAKKGT